MKDSQNIDPDGYSPDAEPSVLRHEIGPGLPPVKREKLASLTYKESGITYTKKIEDVPALYWSYGCGVTSATMLFGYYDRHGYPDLYTGPVNGGVFPLDNSIWGSSPEGYGECPLSASHQGIDGRSERGHADDYYVRAYSDEDPYYDGGWTEHSPQDSVADFMGASQYHNWQNNDGGNTLFIDPSGDPTNDFTMHEPNGIRDGTHGMKLFAESRGYTVTANYNQLIAGLNGHPNGFTLDQYKAEIDTGHPVIIIMNNHAMLGVGYNDPDQIVIRDTWDYSDHTMIWGGTYAGMTHIGVSVFRFAPPAGSDPPVANFTISPATGLAPLTVHLTDTSSGLPTSSKWYFGDGSYSTDTNPDHTYNSPGEYQVILAVTNATTGLSDIKTDRVRATSIEPGISWEEATASAGFSGRRSAAAVVYDNRMWIIGGGGVPEGYANDVWYSPDGAIWTQATGSASFSPRGSHSSVVFNDRIWIIGGFRQDGSLFLNNDVWNSQDGTSWNEAVAQAPFSPRYGHQAVVFDNKMWVIGGANLTGGSFVFLNDVWCSEDGLTWTRATGSAEFPARDYFGLVVFDNKMWIIGGYNYANGVMNDVWYSSDGVHWTQAAGSAAFAPRSQHTTVVFDGRMWVIAGYDGSFYRNDVWYSDDGINWIRAILSAEFPVRDTAVSVVFKNRIWEISGYMGGWSGMNYNDVWYSPPLPLGTVIPFPGCTNPPADPDNDGIYEDVNGDGYVSIDDVLLLYDQMGWVPDHEPIDAFDLNHNNTIDFNDIYLLYLEVTG